MDPPSMQVFLTGCQHIALWHLSMDLPALQVSYHDMQLRARHRRRLCLCRRQTYASYSALVQHVSKLIGHQRAYPS